MRRLILEASNPSPTLELLPKSWYFRDINRFKLWYKDFNLSKYFFIVLRRSFLCFFQFVNVKSFNLMDENLIHCS